MALVKSCTINIFGETVPELEARDMKDVIQEWFNKAETALAEIDELSLEEAKSQLDSYMKDLVPHLREAETAAYLIKLKATMCCIFLLEMTLSRTLPILNPPLSRKDFIYRRKVNRIVTQTSKCIFRSNLTYLLVL